MDVRKAIRSKFLLGIGALILVAIVVLVAAVWTFGPFYRSDLQVHVANAGDMELQSIVVKVADVTYELGSIVPGKERGVVIRPARESEVTVSVTDLQGNIQQFTAGGNVTANQVGDIWIRLDHRRLISSDYKMFP